VACGRWPAKAVVGEIIPVTATVLREGHDLVGATVVVRAPAGAGGAPRATTAMHPLGIGTDRFSADVVFDRVGRWTFSVEGWADPVSSWRHAIDATVAAGQPVARNLEEGARLLERAAAVRVPRSGPRRAAVLHEAAARLNEAAARLHATAEEAQEAAAPLPAGGSAAELLDDIWTDALTEVLAAHPLRDFVSASPRYPVWVDRPRALFGSWYEFFPRSEGGLAAAAQRLPAIADMGFDVVYLPPVHPIGTTFRKGPNNTLEAGPHDPGSPWAIGSADGGHDAIHPDLGTMDDFDAFVAAADRLGMEVALDLALQTSPDHPWVSEHPEWFSHRADGTIACAENPPKIYQDIYPLNFDADPDGIRAAVLRLVHGWMDHGVRIFRVDNPHTKPFAFWEWLIAEVRRTDPDVLFLAEAFTRPAVMHALAQLGFHQNYTYFTWRTARGELEEYLRELTTSPSADHLRPNFFVNTPDILHAFLQYGGPPAFKIRAVLAATLVPSWGVYSGYELYEHEAVRPGSEEYRDSEKYQLRSRDWTLAEDRLAPYLRRLNAARRAHPALQQLRGLTFHGCDNPEIVVYSRRIGADTVLTVVNLDPHSVREATVHLDLAALGLPADAQFAVHDLLGDGASFSWAAHNYVRLDPFVEPAHLFAVDAP
jgi:starch synthase (maltosyl-transferring)